MSQTVGGAPKRPWFRTGWVWAVAGAAVVLIVVATVVVASQFAERNREQRFLDLLDANQTTEVGELPDEQLLVSMRGNCEDIARGVTLDDEMAKASRSWNSSMPITEADYRANVRALFEASAAVCG